MDPQTLSLLEQSEQEAKTSLISLFYVRKDYENGLIDEKQVLDYFEAWRKQDLYVLLEKEKEEKIQGLGKEVIVYKKVYKAVKVAKRGNDVYFYRIRKRLRFKEIPNKSLIEKHDDGYYSHFLYLTLTYDTKRCSLKEAWENVGKEWNKFLSYLKKKFGILVVIRTWEAFQNGYPHIHAIIYFPYVAFRVIRYTRFRKYPEWRLYSLEVKKEIAKAWHSFIDIQVPQDTQKMRYIFKYITKNLGGKEGEKQKQTLGMMWLFRKQSFSISKDFFPLLLSYLQVSDSERLEPLMHNSNSVEKCISEWQFLGIFLREELKIPKNVWIQIFTKPPDGIHF